jgi:HAD superfamily hydrolase (TIGR01509 family)
MTSAVPKRALLFDFDGLIVDSETKLGQALIDVFAEDGVAITFDDFGHLLGMTGADNDRQWEEFVRGHLGHTDMQAIDERIGERVWWDEMTVLPGVRELIDKARAAGWRTGLGTGNSGPLEELLRRLGLADAFDAIVRTYNADIPSKPAPDVFLRLAELLGVERANCIVLEDSVAGCEAAIAAGMKVIACPSLATRGCNFPELVTRVETLVDYVLPD